MKKKHIWLLGILGCGAGRSPAATEAPQTACVAQRGPIDPLVVDLAPEQRMVLEDAMREGVAVVALGCDGLRVLSGCHARGSYGFVGTSAKTELVRLEGAGEIRANLPFGGATLAQQVGKQGVLEVALAMVGRRRTTLRAVSLADAAGSCDGATHFVRGAFVGAFVMRSAGSTPDRDVGQLFDGASVPGVLRRDGELAACKGVGLTSTAAPKGCDAVLRLELVPLGTESAAIETSSVGCPEGTQRVGLKCVIGGAATHVCQHGQLADCRAQCAAGEPESCSTLGAMLLVGQGAPKDPAAAVAALEKACSGGVGRACSNLGVAYHRGLGVGAEPGKAFESWTRGCELGDAGGCGGLGVAHYLGIGTPKAVDKARELLRVGCEGGHAASCFNLGLSYEQGTGLPAPDHGRARELYTRACDGADGKACSNLGVMFEMGTAGTKSLPRAYELYVRSCGLGEPVGCYNQGEALEEGKGVAKDLGKAVALYRRACKEGVTEGCKRLQRLEGK